MVDKMIRYSFILLSGETEGFLAKLQELGVVDVTRSAKPVDEQSSKMLDEAAASKRVLLKLEGINYEKDADKVAIEKAAAEAVLSENLTEGAQKAFVELSPRFSQCNLFLCSGFGKFEFHKLNESLLCSCCEVSIKDCCIFSFLDCFLSRILCEIQALKLSDHLLC